MVKAARVGFTTLLTGALGSYVVNEPSPILALMPTEDDCRRYMVMDVEPIFEASPALAGVLKSSNEVGERNTLLTRRFAGGSLKIVEAKAPRNLSMKAGKSLRNSASIRAHTARILMVDEANAMEVGQVGNPIRLGERRTQTYANRKIIIGSTPVFTETSHVLRAYGQSNECVFEVPCPSCGAFTEILWKHIVWPEGRTDLAAFECPHCKEIIQERYKRGMVTAGQWRIRKPEVRGHAGFRLNALVSLVPNATWSALARKFLEDKGDPAASSVHEHASGRRMDVAIHGRRRRARLPCRIVRPRPYAERGSDPDCRDRARCRSSPSVACEPTRGPRTTSVADSAKAIPSSTPFEP
jgi:phage terminase large subunit GpA-like protein